MNTWPEDQIQLHRSFLCQARVKKQVLPLIIIFIINNCLVYYFRANSFFVKAIKCQKMARNGQHRLYWYLQTDYFCYCVWTIQYNMMQYRGNHHSWESEAVKMSDKWFKWTICCWKTSSRLNNLVMPCRKTSVMHFLMTRIAQISAETNHKDSIGQCVGVPVF